MLEIKINKLRNVAQIKIMDTGMGMTKKDIKNALSTFRHISDSNEKRSVTNGIGFPLTKKLITMMRGKMVIRSKINHGVTIIFEFQLNNKPPS